MSYNEAVNGDLSSNQFAPTKITLTPGSNTISGSTTGGGNPPGDRDFFTFTVPIGFSVSGIFLTNYSQTGGGASSYFALDDATTFPDLTSDTGFISSLLIDGDNLNQNLLSIDATVGSSLSAGNYSIWYQETGGDTTYTFDIVLVDNNTDDFIQDDINANNLDGGNGNDTIYGQGGADTLIGGNGNDFLDSDTTAADDLIGDSLDGGSGNDTLQGEAGNDTLAGGTGNDSLIGDDGSGAGDGDDTLYGNGDADTLIGGGGNDYLDSDVTGLDDTIGDSLDGGYGNDTLQGESGNDTLLGGLGDDSLNGDDGLTSNDSLDGGDGNDTLNGGNGDDILRGSTGNDNLDGGVGIDVVAYGDAAAAVNVNLLTGIATGGAGLDTLSGIERIIGTSYTDTLTSGTANTTLRGGLGNDIYDVRNADVVIVETSNLLSEIDTVFSTVSYALDINLERLVLTGVGATTGSGNTLNNFIKGNSASNNLFAGIGDDTLDGSGGSDFMVGASGNDSYYVDNVGDVVNETSALITEIDTVYSSISYTLGSNVENLFLEGNSANYAAGNTLNNRLIGNSAANDLYGGTGNDSLNGGGGIDRLIGGFGNDQLVGGFGNDTLTGGANADRFLFNNRNEGIDTITDFSVIDDSIFISASGFGGGLVAGGALSPVNFALGSAAVDAADRFIYNDNTGALYFDADGTGAIAAIQIATLTTKPLISNADIFVIA